MQWKSGSGGGKKYSLRPSNFVHVAVFVRPPNFVHFHFWQVYYSLFPPNTPLTITINFTFSRHPIHPNIYSTVNILSCRHQENMHNMFSERSRRDESNKTHIDYFYLYNYDSIKKLHFPVNSKHLF